MIVSCPSCGAENRAEEAGQQLVCSSCFEIFDAPAEAAGGSSPAVSEAPVEAEKPSDKPAANGDSSSEKKRPPPLPTMHERSAGGYRSRGSRGGTKSGKSEDIFGVSTQPAEERVAQRPRYSGGSGLDDTSPRVASERPARSGGRRSTTSRPDSRSASGKRPSDESVVEGVVLSEPGSARPSSSRLATADPFGSAPAPSRPSVPSPAAPVAEDPFSSPPSASSVQAPEEDPFGIVGGSDAANPFAPSSGGASSADSTNPFGGGDDPGWNPFGTEEESGESEDPFGGSAIFDDDEIASHAKGLLEDDGEDDFSTDSMTLEVSSIDLSTEDDSGAGEALFELDLPEVDADQAASAPVRRRKRKRNKSGGKPRGSRRAREKKRKKEARQKRILLVMLMIFLAGGSLSLTEMGPFGVNLLMDSEVKLVDKPKPMGAAKVLERIRSDKSDAVTDHLARVRELKETWSKDKKDQNVAVQLARTLLVFNERYPGVYAAQGKLVDKIGKVVITGEVLKAYEAATLKLMIRGDYALASKALRAVLNSVDHEDTVEDKYLQARIAMQSKDNRLAKKLYESLIKELPTYEAASHDLARISLEIKNFSRAKELFTELAQNKKHAGAQLGLAQVMLAGKGWSKSAAIEATNHLISALTLAKKSKNTALQFEIYVTRAKVHGRAGEEKAQMLDLAQALRFKPGHEESAMTLAEMHAKKGQQEDALRVLAACKKGGCSSPKFVSSYVRLLYSADQKMAARTELSEGRKAHPTDRDLLMLTAQKEYEAKSLKNAIKLYRELRDTHPTFEEGYLKLAELLVEDGKKEEATDVLEEGVDKVVDKMSLLEKSARFHAQFGNNVKAKEYLERVLKEDPSRSDLKLKFAFLLKGLTNYQDAYKYFSELAKEDALGPKDELAFAEVLHRLGRLKEGLGRLDCDGRSLDKERSMLAEIRCGAIRTTAAQYDRAEEHLKRALALEATDRAYYHMGINDLARGKNEQAASNLRRAVELNKKALDAKIGLARALQRLGGRDNLNKALGFLTSVIEGYRRYRTPLEKKQRDPSAFLLRGEIHIDRKDDRRALADFEAGLGVDPGNLDIQVAKAKALYHSDETKKAFDLLSSLIKASPKHAGAHFYLGRMYIGAQAPKAARRHFEKSINYASADFAHLHSAHSSLSKIYKELKNPRKSCEHMKKYLRHAPESVSDRMEVRQEILKTCP